MIEGQMMDMAAEREALAINEQNLRALQTGKTGALLVASVELGALSAKASTSQIEALNAWASHLGELFQLTDDLLDATASTGTMGEADWEGRREIQTDRGPRVRPARTPRSDPTLSARCFGRPAVVWSRSVRSASFDPRNGGPKPLRLHVQAPSRPRISA